MSDNAQPLNNQIPITDERGRPTDFFIRWARRFSQRTPSQQEVIDAVDAVDVLTDRVDNLVLDDLLDVDAPSPSNGQVLTYDTASNTWKPASAAAGSFQGARLFKNVNQTKLSATVDAVNWQGSNFDIGGWVNLVTNPTRITIPSGVSIVELNAQVDWQGTGNTSMRIAKNGSLVSTGQVATQQVGASGYSYSVVNYSTGPIAVVPGDYFEMQLETAASGTIVGSNRTWFAVKRFA